MTVRTLIGDCRDVLPTLEAESFDCVVTSPPYWGLRDYGVEGQMGLEPTLSAYLDNMTTVWAVGFTRTTIMVCVSTWSGSNLVSLSDPSSRMFIG